ncbi:MAG TPA: NAD(P)/FAD-dependent oxidoreductase [Gemmatimonadaceae bacterium]|nr:NAD(P)/FAD-dependent oxidoreductase [Gemmatimonadaceae bacterium]
MSDTDVIIAGAGPAGCSTAWALARAGVRVLLLDRARFPREKPCAEYLSPQASGILAQMGALARCEDAGAAQLAGMIVRAPSGSIMRGDFAADHGFRGFRDRGLALRRLLLDAILLDCARAAGACVEEGVRVSDILVDARGRVRGVAAMRGDGQVCERLAPVVIGADGLRSVVARRLGLARRARWPRRLALIAHYRGVSGVASHGEMHVERDGYVGIAAVDDGLINVAVVVPAARAHALSGNPAAFVDAWLAARPHLAPRFLKAQRVSPVRVTGPFASHARRACAPGAALVGDAADFFDPFTGEGIYAALRGGELLAPAVVRALDASDNTRADAELATYDRRRRTEFGGKWKVERLVGLAVGLPWLMNRAAAALARRKDLADLFVGVAGDFVPPARVLRPGYLFPLLAPSWARGDHAERGS